MNAARTAENPLSRLLLEIANKRMVVKKLTKTNTHRKPIALQSPVLFMRFFAAFSVQRSLRGAT